VKNETWKDIEDYEGLYMVSNFGRVKSLDREVIRSDGMKRKVLGKIMKPQKDNMGYLRIRLYENSKGKSFSIHRLVAMAFLSNDENKNIVNHKDGIKTNNFAENLEWCTHKENARHAWETGLSSCNENQRNSLIERNSKKVYQIDINSGKIVGEFKSATDASIYANCSSTLIINCCNLKHDTAKGFRWRYDDNKDVVIKHKKKKSIVKIDNISKEKVYFKSLTDASKNEEKSIQLICDYLKGRRTDKHNKWEYCEQE
jgi:NUMOD4 motif/HNH endonuclease